MIKEAKKVQFLINKNMSNLETKMLFILLKFTIKIVYIDKFKMYFGNYDIFNFKV